MTPIVNEDELIQSIARRFPKSQSRPLRLAIGDDAALFEPHAGYETILTCDWFLEGAHFLLHKHPAEAIGWKCLARATSDIAAMGGQPRCFLLSLALPAEQSGKWLTGFLKGLRRASKALHCELAGGDTARRKEILVNVTVVGEIRKGRAILRSGARPGDLLYVSGTLGEAELGLEMLQRHSGVAHKLNPAMKKHLYPEPRLALGRWLAEKRLASAMMDLSDGLSTDLPRLCAASGVGARVHAESLPATSLVKQERAIELALHGGDDYELLFAVRPRDTKRIPKSVAGVKLTRIGEITREKRILLIESARTRVLQSGGWDPFRT